MDSVEHFNFKTSYIGGSEKGLLHWHCPPAKSEYDESAGGLRIWTKKDSDFWQKTYYTPSIIKDDGHFLGKACGDQVFLETSFILSAAAQFDQAGIMVRKNEHHWIKAGLEYVDGLYKMGVVVTNEFSDWSTQDNPSGELYIKVYRQGSSFAVEAKEKATDDWKMIRLCHLSVSRDEPLDMGIFTCSPKEEGGSVVFHGLKYQPFVKYHH